MAEDTPSEKRPQLTPLPDKTSHPFFSGAFWLKQLNPFGSPDYLAGSGLSRHDLEHEETNLAHLDIEQQYARARTLLPTAKKIHSVDLPLRSIECLNSINSYIATREAFLNKQDAVPEGLSTTHVQATTIQDNFKALEEEIKSKTMKGEEIGLFSLVNRLIEAKNFAVKTLEEQHEADTKTIDGSIEPKMTPPIKEALIDALKANHKSALDALQETMQAEINAQLDAARSMNSRLALLTLLRDKNNDDLKALIKKAQEDKNRRLLLDEEEDTVSLVAKGDPDSNYPEMKNIQQFKTLSGLTVTQVEPGSFSIQIPSRLNIFYHNDRQNHVLADLKTLALAVKATGAPKIEYTISNKKPEVLQMVARRAYEAAIETGFKGGVDGDISFINGNTGAPIPLFDKADKDGKVTKGVFHSEAELKEFDKTEIHIQERIAGLEKKDKWNTAGFRKKVSELKEASETPDPTMVSGDPAKPALITIEGTGEPTARTPTSRSSP